MPTPEHPVELPRVAPPENPEELPAVDPPGNEVDNNVVPTLFPSDYEINDDSNEEDEDTYTPTQQLQKVIHPEAMPLTVSNI